MNKELVDHFKELANTLKNKKFVLDIGSNDGVLLKPLKQLKINCVGVEPPKCRRNCKFSWSYDYNIFF